MEEPNKYSRGLEDISHYFLTQKDDQKEPTPPPPKSEDQPAAAETKLPQEASSHFFLLGSQSQEARALLASNLACEWSLAHKNIVLIEEENKIPNAHFLMGSLFPEKGGLNSIHLNGSAPIEFSSWPQQFNGNHSVGKWLLWNLAFPFTLDVLSKYSEKPICLVVLEPNRKKLIEAYLEVRQVLAARPDTLFYAVVYSNGSDESATSIYHFFERISGKFLNIEVQQGGFLQKEIHLAKSILNRTPVVLSPDEEIQPRKTLKILAQTFLKEKP